MEDSKTLGVHILNTKEFHHFVSGTDHTMFNIDRLRNILMARGQLRITETNSTQYRITSLEEAKREGWVITTHFANKHVAQKEAKQVEKDLLKLWD